MKQLLTLLLLTTSYFVQASSLSELTEREHPGKTNIEIYGVSIPIELSSLKQAQEI
mgnify:FL=1